MYNLDAISATKVLIVKTSSLGDVIQSFGVLEYLHTRFPGIIVDWAVDTSFVSIVAAHPLVRRAIPLTIRGLKKGTTLRNLISEVKVLREEAYDVVFDLQKNTKSGVVTLLSRSKVKVGFGFKTVREWPNILATNKRFNIPKTIHSNLQYVGLVQRYFNDAGHFESGEVRFNLNADEREFIRSLVVRGGPVRIMVCPGSTGVNRLLPVNTMARVLAKLETRLGAFFYLIWGDAEGKKYCEQLRETLGDRCVIADRMSIPVWQNLMAEMDLVIGVDSSALHLCATTKTASFSFFGPTKASNVKPIGNQHFAIQGDCPYGQTFIRQCPKMRTCSTGACMKNLEADQMYDQFMDWWTKRNC